MTASFTNNILPAPLERLQALRLSVLLAVKGQANNIALLKSLRSFTDAVLTINNPRSQKALLESLLSNEYRVLICDEQLLNATAIAKIASLDKTLSESALLLTFAERSEQHRSECEKILPQQQAFSIAELSPTGLNSVIHMTLKCALWQGASADLSITNRHYDRLLKAYRYHATIDETGSMHTDWMSESFQTVTGYSMQDINRLGGWIKCIYADDLPLAKVFAETLLANKEAVVVYRVFNKFGDLIWLESTGHPEWDANAGRIVGVNGYTRDVTERENCEQKLDLLYAQQNAVIKLGQFAATQPSLQELYQHSVLLITQTLGCWLCELFIVDDNAEFAILQAATGVPSTLIGQLRLPLNEDNELRFVLNQNDILKSNDLHQETRFTISQHLQQQQIRSGIIMNLHSGGQAIGVLALYSQQAAAFGAKHVEFAQTIAAMLSAFIAQRTSELKLRSTRAILVEQTQQLRHEDISSDDLYLAAPLDAKQDFSDVVTSAKQLSNRDSILSAIAKTSKMLIDAEHWEEAVQQVLSSLGNATNVSRVYIFRNHAANNGAQLTSIAFEWTNKDIPKFIEQAHYQNMSLQKMGLQRFERVLSRGGIIVGQTEQFTGAERDYFTALDVKSTAIVPIFVEEKWWGFLGFDAVKESRTWASIEVDALRVAANTISSALELVYNETALQAIFEGTVSKTGKAYFRSLLQHLSQIFAADYCLIAESLGSDRFKVHTALHKNTFLPPFEYRQTDVKLSDLKNIVHYPNNVCQAYPNNNWLQEHNIQGYLAIPILDNRSNTLGHVALMSTQQLNVNKRELKILKIFAARAGVEIERRRMEAEIRQLARISLENPNMLMVANLNGDIVFNNPACEKMAVDLGFSEIHDLLPKNHRKLVQNVLNNDSRLISVERSVGNRTFQWNYYLQNDLHRVHIYGIDMTQYRQVQDKLRKDAFYDTLTQLPNRTFFNNLLKHAIERATRRNDYTFAVLFLDLDRFKYINDSLGHAYGDKFLEVVAQLLKDCLRPGDYIARFGGDEFAILLDAVVDQQEAINIALRLQAALSKPILLGQHEMFTSASIGIALSSRGYQNARDILRDADIAMYSAKQSGKARYAVFDSRMHDDMVHVLRLETDLRNAIKNSELEVYYQPIYSIAEQRLIGLEALVRWWHPERGFLEPSSFIHLAEEMSIIREIDYLVLKAATEQLRSWQKRFTAAKNIKMNVNLSGVHFNNDEIIDEISDLIETNTLTKKCLQLELTEGVLMDNTQRSAEILGMLNQLGVHISIDDFGVGYSSLSHLTKLPVDILKIDRGFIESMIVDPSSLNITRAIIDLAHDLGMEVIAEGVETQGQLQILGRMGCHYVQGFYISKPLTGKQTASLLANPPRLQN